MADAHISLPKDVLATCQIGDVIQIQGRSVPPMFWDKWFRVDSIDATGNVSLSRPYCDAAMTTPFFWTGTGRGSALAQERRSRRQEPGGTDARSR